jgi:hypothetical protein
MSGLDNPRGLAFGAGGALFVAEAGHGGAPLCPMVPQGGVQLSCYGLSGAISRLWQGQQERVVSGFPSVSFRFGAQARGPNDIALRFGKGAESWVLGAGGADVTIGLEADPATRDVKDHEDFGKLAYIPASALFAPSTDLCQGCWQPRVDIAAYEIGGGPDPGKPESDPYGLLVERRGHRRGDDDEAEDDEDDEAEDHDPGHGRHEGGHDDGEDRHGTDDVVTDASGNSLLRVNADGEISLLAVFPSRGTTPPRPTPGITALTDSVPTSVVVGPDGAYYVGELVGIPFTSSATVKRDNSNVYRVQRGQDPEHPTVFLDGHVTGFNAIIDMAFKGNDLYILQNWTTSPTALPKDGKLIRVACGGHPFACDGLHPTTVLDGLDGPTSLAFGPDGALYVTNKAVLPAFTSSTSLYKPQGEVLRVDLGDADDHGHHGHDDHDDHDDHDGDHGHHDDEGR